MANTTSTLKTAETHSYRIVCEGVGGIPAPDKTIEAAYFQQDGQLTVFKGDDGAPIFAVSNSSLLSIERLRRPALASPVESADQTT